MPENVYTNGKMGFNDTKEDEEDRFIVHLPLGLDFLFIPFSFLRSVNEEYWNIVFMTDALPGINHMRGMQYQF